MYSVILRGPSHPQGLIDHGILYNVEQTKLAQTFEDEVTKAFVTHYFERSTDADQWILMETHYAKHLDSADAFSEWKIPDSVKPE